MRYENSILRKILYSLPVLISKNEESKYYETSILNFNVKELIFLFSQENNNSKQVIMQYFSQTEINARIDLKIVYCTQMAHSLRASFLF